RFLRSEAGTWLAAHGLDSPPEALRISLFCYPEAPIGELLAALAGDAHRQVHLLLPGGVAEAAISEFLGHGLPSGQRARVGALTIARHAFLDQAGYDRLLWSCDLNFVRGEDSWVRAHWAERPFVWQPYPQSDDTHLVKLEAFLTRMLAATEPAGEPANGIPAASGRAGEAAALIRAMMLAWSGARPLAGTVAQFLAELQRLAPLYSSWRLDLARRPDLANKLYEFIQTKI
ncbi:MAG: elongation factor P maturation arginine rhamnosyltransferase EarP, partial [Burkholderiaceae bacterium]|nr:elongation factor P maturation arginine rhamnosyltransferase EarP [Burkholderiaceae bacterium]